MRAMMRDMPWLPGSAGSASWTRGARVRFRVVLAALLAAFAWMGASVPAGEKGLPPVKAVLLTRELGDPRAPGNVKLALELPESLRGRTAAARPEDFRVYVHPAGLDGTAGMDERHRAGGVYLWRHRSRIFLDIREVPVQESEGEATVRLVYAPEGRPLAAGSVEGILRYAGDMADVVLAVDISRSMLYNDPNKLRVAASRAFMEMAIQGGGIGRVGLVTFNHRAAKNVSLLPLERGEAVVAALDKVGADGLTNLDNPVSIAMEELAGSRNPVIILLTDGKNEGSVYKDTHVEAAKQGIRIFTVGLSEQADHDLLKVMAESSGGIYFRAVKDSDLPDIYARLAAELGRRQVLHRGVLGHEAGEMPFPVDAAVKRLVSLAGDGARVGVTGGKGMFTTGMTAVQMGRPEPGEWKVSWVGALPGTTVLSLLGDTQFFLDAFPPQLIGGKLSVGATLAEGGRPLPGAEVWVEPVGDVLTNGLRLFDDGLHGDGLAGDGVYAGDIELENPPQRLDLVFRASGSAWNKGNFIRQASGFAIRRSPPPPSARARLGGDVDFGVLFPGETGSALARVALEAKSPRDLTLELSWGDAGPEWPDMSSSVRIPPGNNAFSLEITVPESSRPGDYAGVFRVAGGDGVGDESVARVRVGDVVFDTPDGVDLGAVPPGTFINRAIRLPYRADKDVRLEARADGSPDMGVVNNAPNLAAGQGVAVLEAVVSAPIGVKDGEYSGRLLIRAGPGAAEIPVRWRIEPYSVKTESVTPIPGLPSLSDLPGDIGKPATVPVPGLTPELWDPNAAGHGADTPEVDSPWEKTDRLLRTTPLPDDGRAGVSTPGADRFPVAVPERAETRESEPDFWSAWWIYLLAALLLLLLLLLLLAYLLYRLGRSALARLLLASAIANIILLIIFIMLLEYAGPMDPRTSRTVTVTLVADDAPDETDFSPAEESLLANAGLSSDANHASSGSESASSALALSATAQLASAASGGYLNVAKELTLPRDSSPADASLAAAMHSEAVPVERASSRSMQRRERLQERDSREASMPVQEPLELPEMAEPRAVDAERRERGHDAGEARLTLDAAERSERPVWSQGERPLQPLASDRGSSMAAAAALEKVSLDNTARRAEPSGRRRGARETPDAYPEPRVEIDDPDRSVQEIMTADSADADAGAPGVEEYRVDERAMGTESVGEKPGALPPPGVARLDVANPDRAARGVSGSDANENARPRGGLRANRAAARSHAADGQPGGGMPASLASAENAAQPSSGGGRQAGEQVGERRFDADDAAGGSAGEGDNADIARGVRRAGTTAVGDGDSPSRLGGGGPVADRVPVGPAAGGGSGLTGGPPRRGSSRTGGDRGDESFPAGPSGVPGGSERDDGQANGQGRTRTWGRNVGNGTGEGRFDDMTYTAGDDGQGGGPRDGLPDMGRSDLTGVGGSGLGFVPAPSDSVEWRRNERRGRDRTMAVAASSVETDSLLVVVGDFSRLPDSASRNLFGSLARRIPGDATLEERMINPGDANLTDTLLAVASPADVEGWSREAVDGVAAYLKRGGHIWLDAADGSRTEPFMKRLAAATGGVYGPLDASHQLSDGGRVDAVTLGGKPAVVATGMDWRARWRHGEGDPGAIRFLVRCLNYFLSGDADVGISLEPGELTGGRLVQPGAESIPDSLEGGGERGAVWDEFGPTTAASWRMPSWSDPGRISAISDGEGGRALKMDLGAANKGRAAAYRTLDPAQDFSGVGAVTLDAYYDGGGRASLSMVFTVREAGGWRDYETPQQELSLGWNRIRFEPAGELRSLSGPAPAGGAAFGSTGRAGFFLYRRSDAPGIALFRNIRLLDR